MAKRKILIVADVFGKTNNGTSMTTKRLIDGLKQRDYQVLVVSPINQKEQGYYQLKKRRFFGFDKYVEKNGVMLAKPDKKLLRELIGQVDIVHIILPFKTGKMAVKICKQLGKPFTVGFHCPAEAFTAHIGLKNNRFVNNLIYKRYYNQFYKHANLVHCPTKHLAQDLKNKGYRNKFKVVSNGVSEDFVCNKQDKPDEFKDKFCILYVGRLSVEKRHDVLLKAVMLSKHNQKIQLIFAGDGPTKSKILKLSKKLKNPLVCKFLNTQELVKTMNFCDLYVHCSDVEIEGISCIEAISCNMVPLISDSPRSATKDFALTQDNLFEHGNACSLMQKIDFFIENPTRLAQLKNMYKSYGKQFEIKNCIEKMCEMFEQAIEQNNT